MSDGNEIAHALAGAGGGALLMVVTYPLVMLSTLAQTTKKKKDDAAKKDVLAADIWRTKGFRGFYLGLELALFGITFSNFIYYYFYEWTGNIFKRGRKGRGLSTMQLIVTGAFAGAMTCIGTNPLWVANTRMMTLGKKGSQLTLRTILEIVETDGVATLFAGVLPALVLVVNPIIQYTIFEQIKNAIVLAGGAGAFTAVKAFFIGAFGKLVATTLTYPYITLKLRMHVKKKEVGGELSMTQEVRRIVREEGLEGLYRGLAVKLFQLIMTAAFLFYFKEELLSGSVRLVTILRGVRARKAPIVRVK